MPAIIGIDPGSATGGIAMIEAGRLIDVKNLPIKATVKASKGAGIRDLIGGPTSHKQNDLDAGKLAHIIRDWTQGRSVIVFCEDVGPRPSQGIVTTGRFMAGFGTIKGICAALSLPLELVLPDTWKRATGAPNGEREVCEYASMLFPAWADSFKLVKDNHKAEAVLIALYGAKHAKTD